MNKATLLLFFLILAAACTPNENKSELYGKWQGASWTVNGKESGRDFQAVRFEFREDHTYSATYGDQTENGNYRLSGNKLYTTGENKIEKMVVLSTISPDTLVMDMNRTGTAEQLLLVKSE